MPIISRTLDADNDFNLVLIEIDSDDPGNPRHTVLCPLDAPDWKLVPPDMLDDAVGLVAAWEYACLDADDFGGVPDRLPFDGWVDSAKRPAPRPCDQCYGTGRMNHEDCPCCGGVPFRKAVAQ